MEGGRDANGSVLHGLPHQSLHLRELLRRGLHVGVAKDHPAHAGRAHVACEVDAHALALEPGEEIEKVILPWKQALQMVERGEIQDAKTIAGLLLADRTVRRATS